MRNSSVVCIHAKWCIVILLVNSLFLFSFAQIPDTLWARTYGGASSDIGSSVIQTSDGGYVIAGRTNSFGAGEYDVYLLKMDANGDTLWTTTYGGPGYDASYSVQQTTDGGYVIVGSTPSFGAGDGDVWLLKTDANGDTVWTQTYGGVEDDWGRSIEVTDDGGFVIGGGTYSFGAGESDVYLIKTDDNGNMIWAKTYGGVEGDDGYCVQQTIDSGYIITGLTDSFAAGFCDIWLIKTDSLGDTLWTRTYGLVGSFEVGYSVRETSDGGYVIGGYTGLIGGAFHRIIKTDMYGDTTWTRSGGWVLYDYDCCIQEVEDGSFIFAGTVTLADWADVYLLKIDSNGNSLWSQTYGGTGGDVGHSVACTSDDGYIIVGSTSSFGAGASDVWLIKIAPDVGITSEGRAIIDKNFCMTTIINGCLRLPEGKTCKVLDIMGRVVDPSKITRGIYFLEIDNKIVQKVIKVK